MSPIGSNGSKPIDNPYELLSNLLCGFDQLRPSTACNRRAKAGSLRRDLFALPSLNSPMNLFLEGWPVPHGTKAVEFAKKQISSIFCNVSAAFRPF